MGNKKLKYSEFSDRIDIDAFEEAIGFNVESRDGDNDIGFCLFPENHSNGDTTGKFAIEREEKIYNCWVCGGGSLLSLAIELYDLDVDEATKFLYQFTGDTRDDRDFLDDFLASFDDAERRVTSLPFFNKRVLEKFDEPIPDWWLEEKCIFRDTAERYGVRYSSEATRQSPSGGRYADDDDYVGPAIIFPLFWYERLVGWQTRWLDKDRPEWIPKYTNTSDFPKESTLYGWNNVQWHVNHGGQIIITESVPSVLFAESLGYAAVSTFGSSVTDAQMRLLRRLPKIILAPDNDSAGIKWERTLTEYLKRYSRVWILPPVEGEPGTDLGDIASYARPEEAFDNLLKEAKEVGVDL